MIPSEAGMPEKPKGRPPRANGHPYITPAHSAVPPQSAPQTPAWAHATWPAAPPPQQPQSQTDRPRRRRSIGLIAAAIVLLPLAGFGITYLAASGVGDDKAHTQQDDAQAAPAASSPAASQPNAGADADARLTRIGEQDKRTAEQKINGKWVVQIGAQKIGSTDKGAPVTADSVVETFEGQKASHPDALLLYTSDWSSYEAQGYWVTVIGKPYDSPEPALQVCDAMGLGSEDCFAKKVSNRVGPDGATRTRG